MACSPAIPADGTAVNAGVGLHVQLWDRIVPIRE